PPSFTRSDTHQRGQRDSTRRDSPPQNSPTDDRKGQRPMTSSFRPQFESLESRELLAADWFSTYIANPAVANLARADWNGHGSVNYNDMLRVYSQVEADGRVDASEFASLQFLARY